jgi:hypothetical protein
MKAVLRWQTSRPFIAKFLLLRNQVSTGYCQTALVDESGIIRTQMWAHKRPLMVAVLGKPCATSLHNSNSKQPLSQTASQLTRHLRDSRLIERRVWRWLSPWWWRERCLRNVCPFLRDYIAPHPRRQSSSAGNLFLSENFSGQTNICRSEIVFLKLYHTQKVSNRCCRTLVGLQYFAPR